ncbi:alpha/beta hydrolase family protein [Ottowia thiooxydans]|uniref:alpha/beta hydrolase family protein n=1 Tax=Ottowia thiooxydans TaxID=219182 RepID=UPI0004212736|nr:alpha/beta fold hydrolase [Ottowia thiooxydans]
MLDLHTHQPRRHFMAAAVASLALPAQAQPRPAARMERGNTRVAGFASAEMDYQLIRQLGSARYGGASVGECLALAQRIQNGIPASWVAEFTKAAQRQEADARVRALRGHAVSAREQYLVACNSYRAAEYYCGVLNPEHARLGRKSRECFLAAVRGQDVEEVFLRFGGSSLPAYYVRAPSQSGAKRGRPGKTLLLISGYDGTLEETWLSYGLAALERGYHLLLFTGPGQMDALRTNPGMAFIPEYEHVGRLALDYVLARRETDPRRVALMGISFGGYFATRIASHEPRVRALIANSPIVDLHAYMASFVGFDPALMPDAEDVRLEDIDHIPDSAVPPQTREMMRNLIVRMGQRSFKQAYLRLREFRVDDDGLRGIRCPSLALVGAGEGAEPLAQCERFLRTVGGPVRRHVFSAEEGAEGHCQTGNLAYSAAISMDWLDELFAT